MSTPKGQTEMQNLGDSLLRKKTVKEMLACSLRHVDRLVAARQLTRIRILGAVRFRLSEVQKLMNGGTI